MHVKKYSSATVAEALARIKRELGDEAVILSTRRLERGRGFEVMAALDEPAHATFPRVGRDGRAPVTPVREWTSDAAAHPGPILELTPVGAGGDAARERTAVEPPPPRRGALLEEIRGLSDRLGSMTDALLAQTPADLSRPAREFHLRLVESGMDANMATAILRRAEKAGDVREASVRDALADSIPVGGALERGVGQQVVALVGPTGVGKTTTVAKLAAHLTLNEKRAVAVISADSFRVGASQQLSFYTDILEVPFHTAQDETSFLRGVKGAGNAEVILVDTTGRGVADGEGVDDVARLLGSDPRTQSWLVLSANANLTDNLMALRTFKRTRPTGLVVTKIDETSQHGAIATLGIRAALPLRYVSNGQAVPDDLFSPTKHTVADLVLGEPLA